MGRSDPGTHRVERAGDAERAGHPVRVDRSRAPERNQGELARVLAAFQDVQAGRSRHVLVDDVVNAPCRLYGLQPGGLRDSLANRGFGGFAVEGHAPTGESVGIDISEHQVGIGDGRLAPTQAIANRARRGAGALWADTDETQRIDADDASPAGADFGELDA